MALPVGSVMSAVSVWRNDSKGRSLLRDQPGAGFDEQTVYDYECPYGEPVAYDWTTTYTDPADYVTVFNETWVSDAAWTGNADWNTSSNTVRNSIGPQAILYRDVSAALHRVTLDSLQSSNTATIWLQVGASTDDALRVQVISSDVVSLFGYSGGSLVYTVVSTLDPNFPITIDMSQGSIAVSGTGGSYTVPVGFEMSRIRVVSEAGTSVNGTVIGPIHVQTYPVADELAETSDEVTLNSDTTWLIHPSTPDLSFPVTYSSTTAASFGGVDDVTNVSNATLHRILGSRNPVSISTGTRGSDETGMRINTVDSTERANLRALLASDFPILVQIPPSWGVDFNSGFYAVGATVERRLGVVGSEPSRETHLPLIKVQSPVADVATAEWTYADLVNEVASYAELLTLFATYADLTSNTRS